MRAKIITVSIVFIGLFLLSGCTGDTSGDTQAPKKPENPTTSQMPRSKEEAQKMFGGGGGNPVAPKSNN
ncbi:MAG: hypothetical protein KF857_00760 [Fimbriimonadaceae bacterium]|nr:hypothetical protein [Fimbriimonadaceae bacterium]